MQNAARVVKRDVGISRNKRPKIYKLDKTHGLQLRRRGELARLYRHRLRFNIAIVDFQAWANMIAEVAAFGWRSLDFHEFNAVARGIGIEIPEKTAMAAIHYVAGLMERKGKDYKPTHPTAAGRILDVTCEEKLFLELRTFHGVDENAEERAARLSETKRERDRNAKRVKRVKLKRRHQYEAESLSRTKPWEALGICRRTWERRRKKGDASLSPHITIESLVERHTCDNTPIACCDASKKGFAVNGLGETGNSYTANGDLPCGKAEMADGVSVANTLSAAGARPALSQSLREQTDLSRAA